MWFKQIQLFQLTDSLRYLKPQFIEKLEPLTFRPCLPSMPQSLGWVSPIDEDGAPLVQSLNGNVMICLQIEEKILPALVVRQELFKKIKHLETFEDRKIYQKEKLSLKDAITLNLLPQAFSKLTRIYAYIDTKNNWLVLGTNNEKKTEQFLSLLKKSIEGSIQPFQPQKISTTLTQWLKKQNYPSGFSVEKSCMLQDPNQQNRVIRCQQQDLFATSIQSLIADGCEVQQLAMGWQDRITFVLNKNFSLQSLKFNDASVESSEMEAATQLQQANVDFLIMSDTLAGLYKDLLAIFFPANELEQNNVTLMMKRA